MKTIPTLLVLASLCGASYGQSVHVYSWSGFVEPREASNPWSLSGDGSALTKTDGTPFSLEVAVAASAADTAANTDQARFVPDQVVLAIGGQPATIVGTPTIIFSDDAFSGSFDSVSFDSTFEFLGATRIFSTSVRVSSNTFEFFDGTATDLPPLFGDAALVANGGSGTPNLITIPDVTVPVTARFVPEPTTSVLAFATLGLAPRRLALRRRR